MNTEPDFTNSTVVPRDALRPVPNPCVIVIFGASGDLTERKLMPSLFSLACEGLLPEKFAVVGVARSDLSHAQFRDKLAKGIETHSRFKPHQCQIFDSFLNNIYYHRTNYDDPTGYDSLGTLLSEIDQGDNMACNCLFYLSTPPILYSTIVEQLGKARLSVQGDDYWRRIIIEKPFGRNLQTAIDLNETVHEVFEEEQVYRIDHYLGKETVQNMLVFRFANAIFEPLWNRNYINHVQITVAEKVGLGQRAGYYENAGVLRDMFQNHLLQLLTLTAMEPPAELNATALRDEKVKVLKAIRKIAPAAVPDYTVRGQYRTYRDEPNVKPDSQTSTFAVLKLFVDNWRWRQVPFYLRSGKALQKKMTEIAIQFKRVPHLMFPLPTDQQLPANVLKLYIQPDEGIQLSFETKLPGAGMRTRSESMNFRYDQDFVGNSLPDAYERLILDSLHGDASLFTRSDEIELAWSLVDPILEGWCSHGPTLEFYEKNTWGPIKSDEFLHADGRQWLHKSEVKNKK